MKRICFYHRIDPDGWCSGALVRRALVNEHGEEPEMFGIDYGDDFPWHLVDYDVEVWMVDFSLPAPDMERLSESCADLMWFDHHEPRIAEWDDHVAKKGIDNPVIDGHREFGKAACEIVWEYLYPGQEMPDAVRYCGRYDVWKWHDIPGALPFNVGLRAQDGVTDPASTLWRTLIGSNRYQHDILVARLIDEGQKLLAYRDRNWKIYALGHTFRTTLGIAGNNWLVGACNRGNANSQLFGFREIQDRFGDVDFFVLFHWKRGQWYCHLYKPDWLVNDINCGKVAALFGGGGHVGAAGFQCEELPFALR
jgi:oligoribonuclease NrnB/cAMP/cGMP phosphodiesterase (DHH superfamily)